MSAAENQTSSHKRGAFVVLEGLDRSGKTTQVQILEKRFAEGGRPVEMMRFPDRSTVIGKMIDGYLKSDVEMEDHVIHLLFSANRWEAANRIKSLLEMGTTVVCDRYYHSGIIYSAAKQNPELGLPWAKGPEEGLPQPDVVVFLDLEPEEARKRGGWGEEKYEKEEMQRRVRELFLVEAKKKEVVVVDAGADVEEVGRRVWDVVGRFGDVVLAEVRKVG